MHKTAACSYAWWSYIDSNIKETAHACKQRLKTISRATEVMASIQFLGSVYMYTLTLIGPTTSSLCWMLKSNSVAHEDYHRRGNS